MKKLCSVLAASVLLVNLLAGCGNSREQVLIYTSAEDYRIAYLQQRLGEEFPEYDVTVEYMSTGNLGAKLLSEGADTDCDIVYDLEYGYLEQLAQGGALADLSQDYDLSIYRDDCDLSSYYAPECRNGGAILVNPQVLEERELPVPASYQDLLNPQYKGLISMPSPKSSGTGYMFLLSLVNAWGEEEALAYFDALTENILQYTSSGSGPVNALISGEAAIGLGMTGQAVVQINEGQDLDILYFPEGSPYSLYGQAILSGKEEKEAVQNIFHFLINTYGYENCEKFFPEPIYRDRTFTVPNYPTNIQYADMSGNTIEEKERLLNLWKY